MKFPTATVLIAVLSSLLAIGFFVGSKSASAGQLSSESNGLWLEESLLLADPPGPNFSRFGSSVAVSGDTAIIGAPTDSDGGSAHVFVRESDGWRLQQKLTVPGLWQNAGFGVAVAISGDTAIVTGGGIFIFTRSKGLWTLEQRLYYGSPLVAISGDTLVIGGYESYVSGPAAFVYTRRQGVWTFQQRLIYAPYYNSVSIDGDTIVIGLSPYLLDGSAYVFTRVSGVWAQQQKLIPPMQGLNDRYGFSVNVVGDTVLVGAPQDKVKGDIGAGSVYVYNRISNVWTLGEKLTASDRGADENCGTSLAMNDDTVFIGCLLDRIPTDLIGGSAYVFKRRDGLWTEHQKLKGSGSESTDHFGSSLAISGETLFVGAKFDQTSPGIRPGSAYVFSFIKGATPIPTATPRTMTIVQTSAPRGSLVTVPIELTTRGDERAASFSIHFDPTILSQPSVSLGTGVPSGTVLTANLLQAHLGRIGVLFDSDGPFSVSPDPHQVITVTFAVAPQAPIGNTSLTFRDTPTPKSGSNFWGDLLPITWVDGSIAIFPQKNDF